MSYSKYIICYEPHEQAGWVFTKQKGSIYTITHRIEDNTLNLYTSGSGRNWKYADLFNGGAGWNKKSKKQKIVMCNSEEQLKEELIVLLI